MDAIRCMQCGDVRWSFIGFASGDPRTCVLCGGRMTPERRHPRRGPVELVTERREHDDAHLAGPAAR